jgi:hypothetical protein
MRWLAVFGLAVFAACGGAQSSSTSGDACSDVAAHMVVLAMNDNGTIERPPEMDGVEREFVQQCESAPWSAERRSCLLAAEDQEQTLNCPLD